MGRLSKTRLGSSDGTPSDVAVAGTANVWTRSYMMGDGSSFCVSLRAKSSTGTPDIDVHLEQTQFDPSLTAEGNANATGEGVIGDDYNGWVIPIGSSKLYDILDETWHHFVVSPLALPYMRLLLDGQGANPADCTVEIYVSQKEDRA